MGGRALVVVLFASCDRLFGVAPIAIVDGTPYLRCTDRSAATFACADFDEATPVVYESGVAASLPAASGAVTYQVAPPPGASPPNALWIDSQGDPYPVRVQGLGTATHLHATFAVNVERAPSYSFEIVKIGIDGTSTSDCSANLQIVMGDPSVKLMIDCDSTSARLTTTVFQGVPSGWFRCTLDYDVVAASASLAIDEGPPGTIDLSTFAPIAGTPRAELGVLYAQPPLGGAVGIDDLVITASP